MELKNILKSHRVIVTNKDELYAFIEDAYKENIIGFDLKNTIKESYHLKIILINNRLGFKLNQNSLLWNLMSLNKNNYNESYILYSDFKNYNKRINIKCL